jgi:hypothetical protein
VIYDILGGEERQPYFDTALICTNGHIVNDSVQTRPQFNKNFCAKCGQPTIGFCPSCRKPIQGEFYVPGVVAFGSRAAPPAFCHECGKSYPWTERTLIAAKEIADELEGLTLEDREKLKGSLEDLVQEGPRTEVAKFKLKSAMRKAGKTGLDIMKDVLSDVLSDAVKKSIFGT